MQCSSEICEGIIPQGQNICPICYSVEGNSAAPDKCYILTFLSSEAENFLYSARIEKYLQPQPALHNWHALTADAFKSITDKSNHLWHLLIIDSRRLSESSVLIEEFIANNPTCLVALVCEKQEYTLFQEVGIVIVKPTEIDSWLKMMHGLLSVVK